MMQRQSARGMATVPAMLITIVGFGLVMLVAALFMTGLAQNHIWPRIQARIDQAVQAVKPGGDAPSDSLVVAAPEPDVAPADSLEALLAQVETQQEFLEAQHTELTQLRAQIDSLVVELETVQNAEVARQAKLFAAMRPEEAAAVLAAVDDRTLVAILRTMNARAASKLMPKLNPRRLARLSMDGIAASEIAQLGAGQSPDSGSENQ